MMEIRERIKGCIAIEEVAASVYMTLMGIFPGEKSFWESLYQEEIDHSSFLTDADNLDIFSTVSKSMDPPSSKYIDKTLGYAQFVHRHIKSNPVSLQEALRLALLLEESMVETFTNELTAEVNSDGEGKLTGNVGQIILDERGHISRIRNMMMKKGYTQLS